MSSPLREIPLGVLLHKLPAQWTFFPRWRWAPALLTCEECGCGSLEGRGWVAQVAESIEGGVGAEVVAYCPPCARREFQIIPRVISYT